MTPEEVAEAQARAEEGWVGTFLIDPVLCVAGGVVGGVAVAAAVWRLLWARRR